MEVGAVEQEINMCLHLWGRMLVERWRGGGERLVERWRGNGEMLVETRVMLMERCCSGDVYREMLMERSWLRDVGGDWRDVDGAMLRERCRWSDVKGDKLIDRC